MLAKFVIYRTAEFTFDVTWGVCQKVCRVDAPAAPILDHPAIAKRVKLINSSMPQRGQELCFEDTGFSGNYMAGIIDLAVWG